MMVSNGMLLLQVITVNWQTSLQHTLSWLHNPAGCKHNISDFITNFSVAVWTT